MPDSPSRLGRYELIAEIGRGGMADVKLAMQHGPTGFEKLVVLKILHDDLANDPVTVEMMRDEAKLSALVKHPNVVDVFELGESDGHTFIAMEYLEGESLLSLLDKGVSGKRLDPLSMARIAADVAEGLDAAHTLKSPEGRPLTVVHHDISLGNIFVLYSGHVKLLDFGVAKVARRASSKNLATALAADAKVFVGKLAYMAPEKLDERPGDKRSDLWSLGCVLWESLTSKRLFKGANDIEIVREVRYVNVPPPSTLIAEVPKELDAIVLKCLQRDPIRRYQTAKELAVALEAVLTANSYPAKNYKIGTYMMQTFADRIAARERLLRAVAGPHRPSAELLGAAFSGGDASRDSLPVLDSLDPIAELISGANQVVLPEGSTGADAAIAVPGAAASHLAGIVDTTNVLSTTSSVMEIFGAPPPQSAAVAVPVNEPEPAAQNPFEEDEVAETIYDVVPANAEASRSLRYEADPSWNRSKQGEKLKELQRKAQAMRENPGGRRKVIPFAIGGGVVLLLVMIVAIKSCGGGNTAAPVAKPAPVVIDAAVAMIAIDAPPAVVAVVVPDAAEPVAPEEIEMPLDEAAVKPPDKPKHDDKPRPKPAKSAPQYYAEGLVAWKKNDRKAAYALFTEGRRASSTYANNWYGLGLVHDKAGRKKEARTAYERYLKLAPNAPNGAKLRDHIKKNLM